MHPYSAVPDVARFEIDQRLREAADRHRSRRAVRNHDMRQRRLRPSSLQLGSARP